MPIPAALLQQSNWQRRWPGIANSLRDGPSANSPTHFRTTHNKTKVTRHVPRKRFGQNFLVDERVVADIVSTICPHKDDLLVEIGPGLGALTRPLLQSLDRLHVVEIDRDIIERLRREF